MKKLAVICTALTLIGGLGAPPRALAQSTSCIEVQRRSTGQGETLTTTAVNQCNVCLYANVENIACGRAQIRTEMFSPNGMKELLFLWTHHAVAEPPSK